MESCKNWLYSYRECVTDSCGFWEGTLAKVEVIVVRLISHEKLAKILAILIIKIIISPTFNTITVTMALATVSPITVMVLTSLKTTTSTKNSQGKKRHRWGRGFVVRVHHSCISTLKRRKLITKIVCFAWEYLESSPVNNLAT